MSECVLDASAMVLALSGKTTEAAALRKQLVGARTHAPHLIDAEVGNVLRRHERQGLLSPEEALLALRAAPAVVDHRYPTPPRCLRWRGPYDTTSASTTGSMSPWLRCWMYRC